MTLLNIILSAVIILIGLIFRQIFAKWIIKLLLHFTKKTKSNLDDMLVHAFRKPAAVLITGLTFWIAACILKLPPPVQGVINLLLRIFITAVVFWFLYNATDSVIYFFEHYLSRAGKKSDPSLFHLFNKILKSLIVIMGIISIVNILGFGKDISGIVAGFGLGGLAISLAAKDAAANLIGSITIMIDKTYSIGEWIETEKVEGIVQEIGFRSTKVRTFSDSLVSVPNSIMSNEPVTNWSKMGKRKVSYSLQIPLDTPPDKIEALLARIKEMLKSNEDINQDLIAVNLKGFGGATLEVFIYFFTKTTSWVSYLAVSESVSLKVLRIFEELEVPITVPVQRMIVEKQ
jgi:MscS family membrane protein